jgi:nucleoside-diphosphate-sugar epimerase
MHGNNFKKSANEPIDFFLDLFRREIQLEYSMLRKGEERRISLDISLAKNELGFTPEFSLEEGIRKTIK